MVISRTKGCVRLRLTTYEVRVVLVDVWIPAGSIYGWVPHLLRRGALHEQQDSIRDEHDRGRDDKEPKKNREVTRMKEAHEKQADRSLARWIGEYGKHLPDEFDVDHG